MAKEKKRTYKIKYSTKYDPKKSKWIKPKTIKISISEIAARRNRNVAIMKAIKKKRKLKKDFAWWFKK